MDNVSILIESFGLTNAMMFYIQKAYLYYYQYTKTDDMDNLYVGLQFIDVANDIYDKYGSVLDIGSKTNYNKVRSMYDEFNLSREDKEE